MGGAAKFATTLGTHFSESKKGRGTSVLYGIHGKVGKDELQ